MKRRHLLSLIGLSITATAGCSFDSGSVSLTVQNFSDTETNFQVSLLADGEQVFTNSVTVSPGGKRHLEAVAGGGSYTVSVTTDTFGDASRQFGMNDCEEQEVSIAALPDGVLSIQIKKC